MNEQLQDRIDRFLRDEMNAEERNDFERQVQKDAGLKEQLEFTRMVRTALTSREEKLRLMKKWDRDMRQTTVATGTVSTGQCIPPGQTRRTTHKLLPRIIGLIGFAAMLAVGIFLFMPMARKLPMANMINLSHYENYRGRKAIANIAELIHKKQYKQALKLIEQEERIPPCNQSIPQQPDTRPVRMQAQGASRKKDSEELLWLKAHALGGLGRKKEALECLDQIRRTEGIYKGQADSLYRKWK
ncbi:MAG: hypothetical protein NC388_07685 [Clostridium sp.]|nr:hypothetical protein [Clostridium sp.]